MLHASADAVSVVSVSLASVDVVDVVADVGVPFSVFELYLLLLIFYF